MRVSAAPQTPKHTSKPQPEQPAAVSLAQLFGMTPLLYACSLKDEETALLLLKLGADPHMCDFRACTPVMLCAGLNLPTTLTILLHK